MSAAFDGSFVKLINHFHFRTITIIIIRYIKPTQSGGLASSAPRRHGPPCIPVQKIENQSLLGAEAVSKSLRPP